MFIIVRIGQAHKNRDFGIRMAQAGGPPFAPIEHQLITVFYYGGLHIGGIG